MVLIFKETNLTQTELRQVLINNIGQLSNNLRIIELESELSDIDSILFAVDDNAIVVINYNATSGNEKLVLSLACVDWLRRYQKLIKGYLKSEGINVESNNICLWFIAPEYNNEFKQAVKSLPRPVNLITYKYIISGETKGILFERSQVVDKQETAAVLSKPVKNTDVMIGLTREEETELLNFGKLLNID